MRRHTILMILFADAAHFLRPLLVHDSRPPRSP